MRITKVYTKQGDKGETRLGGGQIVLKSTKRVKAYGTVDELNCVIGVVLVFEPTDKVKQALIRIQHHLFTLGGELCVLPEDRKKWQMAGIEAKHVAFLEDIIDELNAQLAPLEDFVLPGGTPAAAFLHQARCVCRRAETMVVELAQEEEIGKQAIPFLNRLSDVLFVLARYENHRQGKPDVLWDKKI